MSHQFFGTTYRTTVNLQYEFAGIRSGSSFAESEVSQKSSEPNTTVSVVVLTKNSALTLQKCLEAILHERPKEIIAVDAQSTDGTLNILKRYAVKILDDKQRSIAGSRQTGVNAASGKYVMFVDSDVVLTPGCINTMIRELERNDWVGIHAILVSAENVSYWQRAQDRDYLTYYIVGPIARIDTIAALFKRDVLIRCPFDQSFAESAEDVDLSRRLTNANYKLGVSSAIAYHYHRREFSAFVRQRFRNGFGTARLGLKYKENRIFVAPLVTSLSLVIRSPITRQMSLIPYVLVQGPVVFAGVLMGLSKFTRRTRAASS